MFCPNCGKEVQIGGKFCISCGFALIKAKDARESTAVPASEQTIIASQISTNVNSKRGGPGSSQRSGLLWPRKKDRINMTGAQLQDDQLNKLPMPISIRTTVTKLRFFYKMFWWTFLMLLLTGMAMGMLGIRTELSSTLVAIAALCSIVIFWSYIFFLSQLAGELGKSRLTYVGCAILFSYLGVLLTYQSISRAIDEKFISDEI